MICAQNFIKKKFNSQENLQRDSLEIFVATDIERNIDY